MGGKNQWSMPPKIKPLPKRTNILITMQKDLKLENEHVVNSLD